MKLYPSDNNSSILFFLFAPNSSLREGRGGIREQEKEEVRGLGGTVRAERRVAERKSGEESAAEQGWSHKSRSVREVG